MSSSDGQQVCATLLTCIGAGPRYFMPLSDDFNRRYRIVRYGNNTGDALANQLAACEAEVHAADVFLYHPSEWMHWMDDAEAYDELLEKIPARVRKIAFPFPMLNAFWPFHGPDPRNAVADRPLNRHGEQPCYWYADTYVLNLLNKGMAPEEVISHYLDFDIATIVDLDKIMKWTINQAQKNDRVMEIKVADYLGSNFQSLRLFQSINHANNRLLLYVTNQLLRLLDCATVPEAALERMTELLPLQSPVHPSIARHFGAEWASPNTRYNIDDPPRRYLTYAEYLREYVYYM